MPHASQLTLNIPVLETARLRLRGHCLQDFSDSARMWADPVVTRFIRPTPFTPEETWSRLLRYIGHWVLQGFGYWAIEEKATGTFTGEVGFADYRRDITPSLAGIPEIGWVLAPHAHGKGFATEAVCAAMEWGDSQFVQKKTACIIAPENGASVRVAVKCGYREARRTTYHGNPTVIYMRGPAGKGS